jgi:hypothetical protein
VTAREGATATLPLTAATVSASWDGLVVLCASNGFDGVRMSDWHLAAQLAKLTPVLYVDPPMSRLTHCEARQRETLCTARGSGWRDPAWPG